MMMANKEGLDSFSQFRIRVRQSKGNQELNDELEVKANELEKLFAEHKLRTPPGNKSNSTPRITRHSYMQSWPSVDNAFVDQMFDNDTFMGPKATSTSINIDKSVASSRTKVIHRNYSDELISFSDGSPGKFYDMYMQKRDAKLKEEWNSKGPEKEAKLRAMEDSLERSTAEMKTIERLRSFNSSSIFSGDQQHSVLFGQSDDREDTPEFLKQKRNDELRSSSETSLEEVSKHTTPRKKQHLPIKTSSKPRTIVGSVPRSPMKVSSSPSFWRRSQPESPLARSVPNLSYMRKESAEPSSPSGKTTTRSQSKTYSRSKLLHSQSLRKNTALKSEGVILAPLKFDKDKMEQSPKSVIPTPLKSGKDKMEQSLSDKFHNISDTKTSLKKGKDADFSSSGGLIESNVASSFANNDNDDDDMELDSDTSEDRVEEDFENMTSAVDENFDNGTPRPSHEMEKLVNSGSENRHVLQRSFSQVCYASEAGLSPCSVPSNFLNSPVSQTHQNPFSYPHEMSDVDASDFYSPVGSPSSWNSHFLSPTQTDGAAKTRKKWGTSAQNPIPIVKSSQTLSPKDKAKGLKRLLKFGSKNRGTDSLVKDWISATAYKEGDGRGNGRDPPNWSDCSSYEVEVFNKRVFAIQPLHSSIPAPPANFKLRDDHLPGSSIKEARERT
ncbi:uncharacterized protein LOC132645229 isoform X3 [Lycium barbarum]|uniref:uncharacterized protein LOC132645229 isoform X3 n=1 Tax=Lycium barbarum TaxID=112863 RepID=UPI00293EDBD1|nr:uncharacterized protein LOC132645229 isoform X3 [Lycium barbarum]